MTTNDRWPVLRMATTAELLDELDARNTEGQRPKFTNTMDQATANINKVRISFSIREGGLDYRTVDG